MARKKEEEKEKTTTFTLTCSACGATGGFDYFQFNPEKGEGKYTGGIATIYASSSGCDICGEHSSVEVACKKCRAREVIEKD